MGLSGINVGNSLEFSLLRKILVVIVPELMYIGIKVPARNIGRIKYICISKIRKIVGKALVRFGRRALKIKQVTVKQMF